MQILGLSESTPRTESRWRALFWPTIRNDSDFDYITQQGFWVCFMVAVGSFVFNAVAGMWVAGAFMGLFFLLAGLGVRQRSRVAAASAFLVYFLETLYGVMQAPVLGVAMVGRVLFIVLLFTNLRASWLSANWERRAPIPESERAPRFQRTIGDRLSDQLPTFLWPKARYVFYVLAGIYLLLIVLAFFAPLAEVR